VFRVVSWVFWIRSTIKTLMAAVVRIASRTSVAMSYGDS